MEEKIETLIDPETVKKQVWLTADGVEEQYLGRGRGDSFDKDGWFKYVRGTRRAYQGPSGKKGIRIFDRVSVNWETGKPVVDRMEGGELFEDDAGQLRRRPSHVIHGIWERLSVEVDGVDVPVNEMLERRAVRE